MRWLRKIYFEVHNPKLGMLSAFANGVIVYWVNREYGFVAAFLAALKGGLGSFITGGFFGRLTERFAGIRQTLFAYPLGMVVPTCIAYVFIATLHYTTGTPLPLESTLFPMALSMFLYNPVTIFAMRRGFFRTDNSRPPVRGRRAKRESDNLDPATELAQLQE